MIDKCPFCHFSGKEKPIIPEFRNYEDHLVMVRHGDHTHVHGPFSNEKVIREMHKAFVNQAETNGIRLMPEIQERIGD